MEHRGQQRYSKQKFSSEATPNIPVITFSLQDGTITFANGERTSIYQTTTTPMKASDIRGRSTSRDSDKKTRSKSAPSKKTEKELASETKKSKRIDQNGSNRTSKQTTTVSSPASRKVHLEISQKNVRPKSQGDKEVKNHKRKEILESVNRDQELLSSIESELDVLYNKLEKGRIQRETNKQDEDLVQMMRHFGMESSLGSKNSKRMDINRITEEKNENLKEIRADIHEHTGYYDLVRMAQRASNRAPYSSPVFAAEQKLKLWKKQKELEDRLLNENIKNREKKWSGSVGSNKKKEKSVFLDGTEKEAMSREERVKKILEEADAVLERERQRSELFESKQFNTFHAPSSSIPPSSSSSSTPLKQQSTISVSSPAPKSTEPRSPSKSNKIPKHRVASTPTMKSNAQQTPNNSSTKGIESQFLELSSNFLAELSKMDKVTVVDEREESREKLKNTIEIVDLEETENDD